jgi:signal transduction histidine kinase
MSPLLLAGWLLAVGSSVLLLRARRAARRSSERVIRACHELRGPLQNVMLALGAADGGPSRTPAAALAVELTRATRAVEDHSLGAAGAGRHGERRRIELAPVLRDLVAVHDLTARARGRRVELVGADVEASVLGDRTRLVQAIGNLVQNAVEHGDGTVRVGITRRDGAAHVEVADVGRGLRVPVERLVDGRRRGQRGRGLGIVVDALAESGGRLRSAPSAAGARMVAELPRAGPRAAVR